MQSPFESIVYLVKVRQEVLINNEKQTFEEIVAQCTDINKAIDLANSTSGTIETKLQPLNIMDDEEDNTLDQVSL